MTESIDTAAPIGRAMWQMIGILAEIERSLIGERTKASRTAAVALGAKMGRKQKLTLQQNTHAKKLIEQGPNPQHSSKIARRVTADALQGIEAATPSVMKGMF